MWFTLALAVVFCIIVLYVPGFVLGRALALGRFSALAVAPAFSLALFTVLGVLFYKLHITCPGWTLFLAACVLCALVYGAVWLFMRKRGGMRADVLCLPAGVPVWKTAGLYVLVAFVVTVLVFIVSIHTPDGFCHRDDNTVHLSLIRGFLDTGTYSTLNVSVFLTQGVDTAFYPAVWHILVAIVASLFGNGVALATNAAIIATMAVLFPLAVCLLFCKIFEGRRAAIVAGCLFTVAFCGFPWGYLVRGQLCPNMISWMLIPLAFVLVMEVVNAPELRCRVLAGVGALIALVAVAAGHPNGAFVFGMWAVFWGMTRFFYEPGKKRAVVTPGRIAGAALLFVGACALWYLLFIAPPLQDTVTYGTLSRGRLPFELACGLLFRFSTQEGIQPLLTVFTLVGVVYTCKHRRYLWLSVCYVAALAFFVIDASTEGYVKLLLTGFWYADATRTGAIAALFAIPVATLGFVWIVEGCRFVLARLSGGRLSAALCTGIPAGLLVVALALTQFVPATVKLGNSEFELGLDKIRSETNFFYSWNIGLTAEEDAFVKRVMQEIPEGSLVINVPSDGSCWSYGAEGLETYFRRSHNRGLGGNTESKVLRMNLKDAVANKDVQKILRDRGIKYLLILDDTSGDKRTTVTTRYEEEDWAGIETITPETPGFKLLLSEGDMRLYEIAF